MFSKRCSKCDKKIGKDHNFCPYCGKDSKGNYKKEDYGILGRDDFIEEDMFGLDNSFIEKLFNSTMKMMEKQMQNMNKEMSNNQKPRIEQPSNNLDIQFFVNGKKVLPQKINENIEQVKPVKINNQISKEKIEKFVKLPRVEPESKIRRLSGRIIYEISVPGVKDTSDILINQLENSIEIKALSKDKVYSKILNVNLPILGYELIKNNLILEFQAK